MHPLHIKSLFLNNSKNINKVTIKTTTNFKLIYVNKNDNPPPIIQNTQFTSIIPLNLFQTWHSLDLPPKMKESVELLKAQNPEFNYYLYDDTMCRDFIKNNFEEDVLYAFDKLKPGAYKADLWRYCVLYIYGGIYLDIKYNCVNGFKLMRLTDKEYFVRDKIYSIDDIQPMAGIYQAFLVCLPKNNLMHKCIEQIINACNTNIYNNNDLCVTGPHLIASCFNNSLEISKFELYFNGAEITENFKPILKYYKEYRDEQDKYKKTEYYKNMWIMKDIYNYPTLRFIKKIDLSRTINRNIYNSDVELFSGTPTIVEYLDNYIINLRWINYSYNEDGSKKNIPTRWISLNSKFLMNKDFTKISDEIFLEEDFEKERNFYGFGLEDIRIFNYKDDYYYISSYYDETRKHTSVSSDVFNIDQSSYTLNRNIILPTCYDIRKIKKIEKNWSFFIKDEQLYIVYKWFPLQIGKIHYETNKMNIIGAKNMPAYFHDVRGSTCGYKRGDEMWFVAHKAQSYRLQNTMYYNYQHFFAVFDLNMNLIRYSELFKFGDCKVEFCIGFIIKENEIILSYSLLDTQSIIATYDIDYINIGIKWHVL